MAILIILLLCLWSANIYKEEEMNSKQLEIDLALALHKLSPAQLRNIVSASDRKFDCAKEFGFDFTGFCKTPTGNLSLIFEGILSEISYFEIGELSDEDKNYLIELIKSI